MQGEELTSFIASLWVAGLALPCSLEDTTKDGSATIADVATEAELVAAIADPHITTIILTNDLILLETLDINRSNNITLDLGGHRIASLVTKGAAIQIQAGALTITGRGSIVTSHEFTDAIHIKGALTNDIANYSSLTLHQRVALYAPEGFGVYVVPNLHAAYGVKVKLQGKIVAHDGIGASSVIQGETGNLAEIIVADGAKIEVDSTDGKILDLPKRSVKVSLEAGEYRGPNLLELAKNLAINADLKLSANGKIARVQPRSPETQLPLEFTSAREELQTLVTQAQVYLDEEQVGRELGEWQSVANKSTAIIRRALKTADKILHNEKNATLEQITHLIKRLQNAIHNIEHIADEMRTEILSILATAEELEPKDYSIYSYGLLSDAMTSADALVGQADASLNDLYSAFCDVRLNIDLLDDPEDESGFILPRPQLATRSFPARRPKVEVSADMAAHDALLNAQQNLRNMLEAVESLTINDYRPELAEQFGELQVAIVKARALLSKKNPTLPKIMDMMDEVKFATAGLQLSAPEEATPQLVDEPEPEMETELDWSALRATVAKISQLQANDYTPESYNAVLNCLEQAKVLLASPDITQMVIDDYMFELNLTLVALIPVTPIPVSQQFILPPVQKKRRFIFKSRRAAKLFS